MLEFSSISVSTYDSASLAERLTERSADGWDVVSIVQTGTTVTAFISRPLGAVSAAVLPEVVEATPFAETSAATQRNADDATAATTATTAMATVPEQADYLVSGSSTGSTSANANSASQAASSTDTRTDSSTDSSAAAAPAGWYADPANRFELRYWDGDKWTEYVSRGGQQFTDPPVA
jgi:hypothetical protein